MIKMDKSISLPSKALPWILPTLFVTAPQNSSCIILSPWVENILLNVGELKGNSGKMGGQVPIIELLQWLNAEHRKSFTIYVREINLRDERLMPFLAVVQEGFLQLREIPNLHAKLVITDDWILQTSANLLWRSYNINVENAILMHNPLGGAINYFSHFKIQQGFS